MVKACCYRPGPTSPRSTLESGTWNADNQLSNVTLNALNAAAGDFFLSIEISPKGKASQGRIVREAGQCKLIRKKLTQDVYDEEREKSCGLYDIFMLYTDTKISDDFTLLDRSGLVNRSCRHSYFGPFSGRAFMALKYSNSEDQKRIKAKTPHPLPEMFVSRAAHLA